jgi:hypothetical protein
MEQINKYIQNTKARDNDNYPIIDVRIYGKDLSFPIQDNERLANHEQNKNNKGR